MMSFPVKLARSAGIVDSIERPNVRMVRLHIDDPSVCVRGRETQRERLIIYDDDSSQQKSQSSTDLCWKLTPFLSAQTPLFAEQDQSCKPPQPLNIALDCRRALEGKLICYLVVGSLLLVSEPSLSPATSHNCQKTVLY